MKIALHIKTLKQANKAKDLVDTFIIPIDNLSINYESTFNINQIKKINNIKKSFVVINKNIHNDEIDKLKKILQEIEKINVLGIIFYDVSIVNLKNKLKLKTPLVWHQEHLVTNYQTINYWGKKNVEYAYLSSELTKREIDEISKNTKIKTLVNVFGYLPMFTSKRNLVNNYLKTFDLKDNKKLKKISKENKFYIIKDEQKGTTVYSDYILNALDEDFSNFDYIVFNSNYIDEKDVYDTIKKYKEGSNDYKYPINHGFLYQETIYKVKKWKNQNYLLRPEI